MHSMNRKEALKRISLMVGGAISAPVATAFLNGFTTRISVDTEFTAAQEQLLRVVADIIIPETDTPGATEAGVLPFISDMVFVMYSEKDRVAFFHAMEDFQRYCRSQLGTDLTSAEDNSRTELIYEIHRTAFTTNKSSGSPWSFIRIMKELTITGYFSSETGMTQVLQYTQIPGEYRACISFEEAGGRVHAR